MVFRRQRLSIEVRRKRPIQYVKSMLVGTTYMHGARQVYYRRWLQDNKEFKE